MQTYYARAWIGKKEGKVEVLYSWSWLNPNKGENHVCLVTGLVAELWGKDHPSIEDYNGQKVLHVHSERFTKFELLTPLTEELL